MKKKIIVAIENNEIAYMVLPPQGAQEDYRELNAMAHTISCMYEDVYVLDFVVDHVPLIQEIIAQSIHYNFGKIVHCTSNQNNL